MIIGLIGFGKVSKSLVDLVKSEGIAFITSKENRSPDTIKSIEKEYVEVMDTFEEVARNSDILISANSPKNALKTAKLYGKHCSGIYLDLNNISPKTTLNIENEVSNFVDGAIIGKIDSENPTIYLSGEKSDELLFLNEFLNVRIISYNAGDASTLKMLRSTYTKTLSAILIESYDLAEKQGLGEEFLDVVSLTECDEFKNRAMSRISNTKNSLKRKSEELEEILECFGDDLEMVQAAYRMFRR